MTVGERNCDIIDLTDGDGVDYGTEEAVRITVSEEISQSKNVTADSTSQSALKIFLQSSESQEIHVPELPQSPLYSQEDSPPQAVIGICKALVDNSLTLAWHIGKRYNDKKLGRFELWTCIEPFEEWKKVGDIEAMVLPMSCTLTGVPKTPQCYAMRAVDVDGRYGPFSIPCNVVNSERPNT